MDMSFERQHRNKHITQINIFFGRIIIWLYWKLFTYVHHRSINSWPFQPALLNYDLKDLHYHRGSHVSWSNWKGRNGWTWFPKSTPWLTNRKWWIFWIYPPQAGFRKTEKPGWFLGLWGIQVGKDVHIRRDILILLMAFQSGVHQLRLVVYPIIYRVSAPSQVVSQISAINSSFRDFWNSAAPVNYIFHLPGFFLVQPVQPEVMNFEQLRNSSTPWS